MPDGNLLKQLPRPTIFAHRGSSYYAPENTLAAFRLAIQQGSDAIELDAKLSADGHVVVIHDQSVDRTTSGNGKVADLPLTELRKLDAGSHFDIAFRGETIPLLDEVLETVGRAIYINIELTNYASITDSLPEKVAQLVQRHKLSEWVMFSSFNPIALLRVRWLVPDVPIGLLALRGQSGNWARSWIGSLLAYQALHPNFIDVGAELIDKVHKRTCRIQPYTVNNAQDLLRLQHLGVDGVITDDPVLACKIYNRSRVET